MSGAAGASTCRVTVSVAADGVRGLQRNCEKFSGADGDEGFVSLKQAHEAAARALEKKRSADSSSSKPAAKKRK